MAKKIVDLPINFHKNFHVFQKLNCLEENEELRNIVIVDYESLSHKQYDLKVVLGCWFLSCCYFHVIILMNSVHQIPYTSYNQNITVIQNSSQFLKMVNPVSDHIVTQIMMCFSNGLLQTHRCCRAYYCLSEDANFPDGLQFMECTGHEHVYCDVLRSVKDFLDLRYHFRSDMNDPIKMNVFPLLQNDILREWSDNSGKLMFFVKGEKHFNKTVTTLWKELRRFGNAHSLPVSVTTAFPSVDYEEIQCVPHKPKPLFYRFAIYIKDAKEENAVKVLDLLRPTQFEGTNWSLKLDKVTKAGRFMSVGDKRIAAGIYKVCKYYIKKGKHVNNEKYFEIITDENMRKFIQEAKEKGLTMKVRHAKILFCGASGAGKTSFARLLKNKKFQDRPRSTGLGDLHQIMVSEKASFKGTEWIDLDPTEELLQLKLRMHYKLSSNQTEELAPQTGDSNSGFTETILKTKHKETSGSQNLNLLITPELPQQERVSVRITENTETEKRLFAKFPNLNDYQNPSEVWDILTLLDTGGQPQFINMLPAVNSSATITFVVLNMLGGVNHLEERVQVHHYNEDGSKSYEPYPLNYTNRDLIKCLIGLLKDSILRDISLPEVFISKHATDSKPALCFVGTHLDRINHQVIDKISEKLEELLMQLKPNDSISIWNLGRLLFAVDNTVAGMEEECKENSVASEIRSEVKQIIETKAVYEVPIPWVILEIEIRRMCNIGKKSFISISEVEMLYERILPGKNVKSEVKAALRFHHMFGVLLYFHEVPGMNNYVISNPQWLFANLTNLVRCSFDKTIVDHKDFNEFKMKGILTNNLIKKLNNNFLGGIKLEYFLELLKYLKIITPYPADNSTDYLMLTVLDSFQQEQVSQFCKDFSVLQEGVVLLMQLQSGTLPRGVFCCLIVQLIRQKSESWKLQVSLNDQRCIYENLVVFCTNFGDYIFLHDKVTHLEVQVRQKEPCTPIHLEVQQSLTQALKDVCFCSSTAVNYGFYCDVCLKPIMDLSEDYVSGQRPFPPGLLCDKDGCTKLTILHMIWFRASQGNTSVESNQLEKEVFKKYYFQLIKILPIKNILYKLVPEQIISPDDIEEINSLTTSEEKCSSILENIAKSLAVGITRSFYALLNIMDNYGGDLKFLAKSIQRDLIKNPGYGAENIITPYQKSISLPTERKRSVDNSHQLDRCISEPSSTGSNLNNLISFEELENFSVKYDVTDTTDNSILTNVQVLVITTSEYECHAVLSYLHPLSGKSLTKYGQLTADGLAFYVIGKYGECTSAVRKVNTETCTIHTISLMATKCFPKLAAIFTIGTITGVSDKVRTFDVLVSTDICTYEVTHSAKISKKAKVNTSSLFSELFGQPPKWPKIKNKLINRLKDIKPHLHQGTILCGPDVTKQIGELLTLYPKAIGIDSSCAKLFTDPCVMANHIMTVKCVSDKQDTQPTAALLAADCLEHYLKCPQLPQFLTVCKGKCAEVAGEQLQ